MYLLLILFFASLFSIIFMIGRKWGALEREKILNPEEVVLELPYLKEIKRATVKNIKKYGYAGLVIMVRLYVQSTNFLKRTLEEIKIKIKNGSMKNSINGKRGEISKFLRVISEYKYKIREIKHRIKKEEDL